MPRTNAPDQPSRSFPLGTCIIYGLGAGLLGVAAYVLTHANILDKSDYY